MTAETATTKQRPVTLRGSTVWIVFTDEEAEVFAEEPDQIARAAEIIEGIESIYLADEWAQRWEWTHVDGTPAWCALYSVKIG